MTEVVIDARGLSKQFSRTDQAGYGAWLRALGRQTLATGNPVLRDVSLRVCRGDAIAVLGENGAGKSTLLKIIAGLLQPDAGSVSKTGSIGAMLELGVGFDEQMSGRDNALQACQLAGMSAAAAAAAMPELESFAELGEAIEEPVGHYSSGMAMRLGFAVMTVTCPQVLISDEVLAVGDESFQKKCIAWVESYLADGGTLLLVSHSLYHVQRLCSQAIWLHLGVVKSSGDVFAVSQDYLAFHEQKLDQSGVAGGSEEVAIDDLQLTLPQGDHWTDTQITAKASSAAEGSALQVRWQLGRLDGAVISAGSLPFEAALSWTIELPGTWLPGNLRLDVWPQDAAGNRRGRTLRRMIRITGRAREFGTVRLPHRWLHHD